MSPFVLAKNRVEIQRMALSEQSKIATLMALKHRDMAYMVSLF
jgi:hypothetical protein